MLRYVYNKEIEVVNREPHILDAYPNNDKMSWYAIYHRDNGDTTEWHVKASNVNEALGIFFVENTHAMYYEIIDHVELA